MWLNRRFRDLWVLIASVKLPPAKKYTFVQVPGLQIGSLLNQINLQNCHVNTVKPALSSHSKEDRKIGFREG